MTTPWFTNPVPSPPEGGGTTHALVIGVSAYDNLPDDATPPRPDVTTFGLRQLRSAAAGSWAFANWLKDHYNNPAAPLSTVRLLLSPSQEETAQMPDLAAAGCDAATAANVERELFAWRADCFGPEARSEHVAILYVAGHGIMLSKDDGGIVLLQDFGEPSRPILKNSLDVPSIRRGLAGSGVAQNQFFFIDACQVRPTEVSGMQMLRGGVGLDEPVDRPPTVSAIYTSAAPGTLALGAPGRGTLFSQAVIECLEGLAVELDRDGRWVVTDTSMVPALRARVMELAEQYGTEQVTTGGGVCGGVVLHAPSAVPLLEVTFMVDPDAAASVSYATLRDGSGTTVLDRRSLSPPLVAPVPAGLYTLGVAIEPATPPYCDKQIPCFVKPPKPKPFVVPVQ